MLNIQIKTVTDDHQRCNTVGDYYTDESGKWALIVLDMNNWRYEFLTAVHELVENALCVHRSISDDVIDSFAILYKKERGLEDTTSKPGNEVDAPHHREHISATKVEKMRLMSSMWTGTSMLQCAQSL